MESGRIGCEEECLWRGEMEECRRVNFAAVDRLDIPPSMVYNETREIVGAYSCSGTAIFAPTCPVFVAAAFTIPSVPAEKRCSPSALKARVRQLPL